MGGFPDAFVVERPDGFIGIEVDASVQYTTVAEARAFAQKILKTADKAVVKQQRRWTRKIATCVWDDDIFYAFSVEGLPINDWQIADSRDLERLLVKHKITHVDSTFGDDEATPESPRRGLRIRTQYVASVAHRRGRRGRK